MFPWPREPGKCEKDTRCSDGRRGAEVRRQRGGGAVWTARAGLKKSLKLPGLQELRLQGPARPMLQGRATSHRLSVPWLQHPCHQGFPQCLPGQSQEAHSSRHLLLPGICLTGSSAEVLQPTQAPAGCQPDLGSLHPAHNLDTKGNRKPLVVPQGRHSHSTVQRTHHRMTV